METEVKKWDNSLAHRIPQTSVEETRLERMERLSHIADGHLVINESHVISEYRGC